MSRHDDIEPEEKDSLDVLNIPDDDLEDNIPEFDCDLCEDTKWVDDGENMIRCPDCNYKREKNTIVEMDDDSD